MKPIYAHFAGALALSFAIAACVPTPRSAPPVQVRPTPAPAPTPTPTPAPVYDSWMDAPQTLGDWSYRAQSGGGIAEFGSTASEPLVSLRCEANVRTVVLTRFDVPASVAQMTVRSESQTRTVAASVVPQNPRAVAVRLAANDRLLDAMALSKGRFAVEVAGAPPLYLPSWAEVTRVIEDCR